MPPDSMLVYATAVATGVLAAIDAIRRARRRRRRRHKKRGQYQDLIR